MGWGGRILALLVATLSFKAGTSEGNCFWVQGLDWCTGTNDGPNGERWAFLAAAMLYCVHSTIRTNEHVFGCSPETDATICKSQGADHLPDGEEECYPLASDISYFRVPMLSCMTGTQSPECDEERLQLASELGCPECAEAFEEGQEVQGICLKGAGSQQECENVNPGNSFVSAALPSDLKISGCGVRFVRLASSTSSPQLSSRVAAAGALLVLVSLTITSCL